MQLLKVLAVALVLVTLFRVVVNGNPSQTVDGMEQRKMALLSTWTDLLRGMENVLLDFGCQMGSGLFNIGMAAAKGFFNISADGIVHSGIDYVVNVSRLSAGQEATDSTASQVGVAELQAMLQRFIRATLPVEASALADELNAGAKK